jgi:hypothetical protein
VARRVYLRCGSRSTRRHYYYCSSNFAGHGPRCGARSVQQEPADQTVEQIVSDQLLDTAFLRTVLNRFHSAQPVRDQDAEKLAHQREKLEAERQRLLRMTLRGACSEEDYTRESKRIETEMRDLARLAPAPLPPTLDPAKLIVHITRSFVRFAKQSFEEKHNLLRMVFREIVLDNGTIPAFTLNGAFLHSCNSLTPSSWP